MTVESSLDPCTPGIQETLVGFASAKDCRVSSTCTAHDPVYQKCQTSLYRISQSVMTHFACDRSLYNAGFCGRRMVVPRLRRTAMDYTVPWCIRS
jgi:hypothetical protein